MKSFISILDHSPEDFISILHLAARIKKEPEKYAHELDGKILANLFYESSTRTSLSFQSAMQRLGGSVLGFATKVGTSADKGESLTDTIHMAVGYSDIVVLRHPKRGSGKLASEISSEYNVPVISGGSGSQTHPTQSLLDIYSIWETQNRVDGLTIGISGDLRYSRTIPSLLQLFNKLSSEQSNIHLFAHDLLKLPDQVRYEILQEKKLVLIDKPSIEDDISNLDVLYFTRIQRERFPDDSMYQDVRGAFVFQESYFERVKPNFTLLHPLPRVDEIGYGVDKSKHAYYFKQAKNGVFVRMSLILHLLKSDLVSGLNLPKELGNFPK
ncbi:MAG: Aspartate carbamoyltransferase [Candidatus Heimdallarchaeota archaeon LC_3]|nr:MAG: Aspartate carbamoyltransferase [Candidatus Heimdallarchaeota archaeon LC_3]